MPRLIYITPEESLLEAIRRLIGNKIHRLPVIDAHSGNVLYVLTHKRLLRFLFLYVTHSVPTLGLIVALFQINELPRPPYMSRSIEDLGVGTFGKVETVSPETSIIEALNKFVAERVSALPVVDDDGKLVDIYAKFDVINLAAEKTYGNLDVSVRQANKSRNEWFEGVHTCAKTDSLFEVMEILVKSEVHRLVVVDQHEKVVGVVSLSDILSYLVLRPAGKPIHRLILAPYCNECL